MILLLLCLCIYHYHPMMFVFCSSANKCLLKVAMYSAQMEEYSKALEIYEQVCLFTLIVGPQISVVLN